MLYEVGIHLLIRSKYKSVVSRFHSKAVPFQKLRASKSVIITNLLALNILGKLVWKNRITINYP